MKIRYFSIFALLFVYSCSATEETAEEEHDSAGISELEQRYAESNYVKGIARHEQEEYDDAIEYLSHAHQYFSDKASVNYALADAHYENGDYTDVIYYATQAVGLEPESKWYGLLLARAYTRNNQDDEAQKAYENILEYHPNEVDIYYRLASLHSRNANYEKANEVYKNILDQTGPQRSIYYQKFQNYSSMDDEENAIRQLENISELEPGNLNIIHMLSQYYLEAGQSEKAYEAINEALERNPDDPETLINLADLYIEEEEYEKGSEILISVSGDTLVEHNHKMEIAQFLLSQFAADQDNDTLNKAAQTVVDTLTVQYPDEGYSHILAAEYYELKEDWDRVRAHLEETTNLMPDNSSAWQQRLQALYMEENYEKAIQVGLEANEHVPDDALIKFFTGSAYSVEDQHVEAIEWLTDAADMPARNNLRSMIYGSLGDAYSSLDNFDDAYEAYSTAIDYDENNDVALNNYAYFLAEEEKELEKAKEMAEQALEMQPENSAFLDTMGWIYFKMGDAKQAKEYIKKSIDTGDATAEVKEHMGDVYEELGDMEKARKWWGKALEKDESRTYLEERISGA